jgi:F-type H+-transporting ATPase subunit c
MKKTGLTVVLFLLLLTIIAPAVFAGEAGTEAPAVTAVTANANINYYSMAALACGIAIGVAAMGAGIGQGLGLGKACEGVSRNPGASGKITTTLIIGLAMIESLAIYALVVVLIILFMNPFHI